MCITLHFSGLNLSNHLSDHLANLSRSCCRSSLSSTLLITLQIFVSSANILILFTIHDGRSLTNIRNKRGPKTDPCGTPLKTSIQAENDPITQTLIFLSFKKALIQFSSLPVIPLSCNFSSNRLCGTVSNALR